MAVAYLTEGATDLAAGNWSDATGFADSATLVINSGSQTITNTLQPSLANGIDYLDVLPGFSGNIGGSGGSLCVETRASLYNEATVDPRIRYWASGGTFYYSGAGAGAAGDACHFWQQDGGGRGYLTGTYTQRNIHLQNGTLDVGANVAGETAYVWYFAGGSATVQYNATGAFTYRVSGGDHIIKRGAQTGLYQTGGSVRLDGQGSTYAATELHGGTMQIVNSGTHTAMLLLGGVLDLSRLARPMTITTLIHAPTARVIPSKLLTITNNKPIGTGAQGLT